MDIDTSASPDLLTLKKKVMQNETKNQYFNPTCVVTGKTDKLRMFAHRDKNDNMVGWVFLHEDVEPNGLTITTEYKELEDVQTVGLPE